MAGRYAELVKRDGHRCAYCNGQRRYPESRFTIDHIIPLSRGGYKNVLSNMVLACSRCNSNKADMTPQEWMATPVFLQITNGMNGWFWKREPMMNGSAPETGSPQET